MKLKLSIHNLKLNLCVKMDARRRVHEKILDNKNYKCELCIYATSDNFRLRAHLMKQHGMEIEEAQDVTKDKKRVTDGNKDGTNMDGTKFLHHNSILNIDTIPCDECDQSFTSTSSLERHIKLIHDNLKEFKCRDCEYGASVQEDLMVHVKVINTF